MDTNRHDYHAETPLNRLYLDHDPSRLILREGERQQAPKPRKQLDRHGLKMTGLKKAAGATRQTIPGRLFVQISYHLDTGKVYTSEHTAGSSCMVYGDRRILYITATNRPLTMQTIADMIGFGVEFKDDIPF